MIGILGVSLDMFVICFLILELIKKVSQISPIPYKNNEKLLTEFSSDDKVIYKVSQGKI